MKWLWIVISLPSISFGALCDPLTDPQYRTEIVKIVSNNIPTDEDAFADGYAFTVIRQLIRYREAGGGNGSTEDVASRCFARDFYKRLYGVAITQDALNHIKQFMEDQYPGHGFLP